MASSQELITTLNSLACITFSGPQAAEYLQGQVTIDVQKMTEEHARYGAHCDFKGKTWSVFSAILRNDVFHLVMQKSALEKSLSEFKKYGVFSKVDIVETNDSPVFYGVCGKQSCASINSLFPQLSEQHLSIQQNQFGAVVCINITNPRYLLMLNMKGDEAIKALGESSILNDESQWQALEILDGIPHVTEQTSNEFVPQMLNLQALTGIDFDKGCYMGQETVARTKFLGRNKRASYILKAEFNDKHVAITPSMPLEKQAGENWRSGGTILQSASASSQTMLLAVLANDTQTGDVLRLKAFPEYQFEVSALPYNLD